MSDEITPTQAVPTPVDPVAEARRIMAAQAGPANEVSSLKNQVKALWITVIVTLVLVIALGAFSLLPRMFGIGRPNFGNGNFQPGQFRGQGTGQGNAPAVPPTQ